MKQGHGGLVPRRAPHAPVAPRPRATPRPRLRSRPEYTHVSTNWTLDLVWSVGDMCERLNFTGYIKLVCIV